MLFRVGENGQFYELKDIPYRKNFDRWVAKFPEGSYEKVCTFLTERIEDEEKFAVGTLVPKVWDEPLISVYETADQDEEGAGMLVGLIVLKLLIDFRDSSWVCTKTALSGRDLETNFYWRKN